MGLIGAMEIDNRFLNVPPLAMLFCMQLAASRLPTFRLWALLAVRFKNEYCMPNGGVMVRNSAPWVCIVYPASGTGAWEAALTNTLSGQDHAYSPVLTGVVTPRGVDVGAHPDSAANVVMPESSVSVA
jgi:hypothetical protein